MDAIIVLQILAGAGLLAHGIPKLMHLNSTLKWFSKQGYGVIIGAYTVALETIGAFLLIVGIFPRVVAALIALNMVGAMFDHWRRKESFDGGWEPAFLYFSMCIVIVLGGVGWF